MSRFPKSHTMELVSLDNLDTRNVLVKLALSLNASLTFLLIRNNAYIALTYIVPNTKHRTVAQYSAATTAASVSWRFPFLHSYCFLIFPHLIFHGIFASSTQSCQWLKIHVSTSSDVYNSLRIRNRRVNCVIGRVQQKLRWICFVQRRGLCFH